MTFCFWLLWRARIRRDRVEVMVHEAYLPFKKGAIRQNAAALAHRAMAAILLRAAWKVWYAIPAWETHWRPYYLGRRVPSSWLPLPSNLPVSVDPSTVAAVRRQYATAGGQLIGHFGTFARDLRRVLVNVLLEIPATLRAFDILLIGPGGAAVRDEIIAARPDLQRRVHATGAVPVVDLPSLIGACDVMLQPYADGVTSRRTTFMACIALGRPTVTTIGRNSEALWEESGAAMLAAPSDIAGLVRATTDLLSDAAQRSHLGEKAARLYADRFEPRHVLDALRQDPER
jgi:glycosyltransferase involved in cell wall biosynthesis